MFEGFDFRPGIVKWNSIIKDTKWDNPVFKEEYRSVTELYEGMKIGIYKINHLIK